MKINFPSLFQTPLHKYNVFFIYGNDPSVFQRAITFIQKFFHLPLQTKSQDEFLEDSCNQLSLFQTIEKEPLLLISNVSDKIVTAEQSFKLGTFIFTSDKARAKSKSVTFFSQVSYALAISAYATPLLSSEFDFLVEELNLPVSFKGQLFKAYQNDYMGLLSTLEKIKLFGEVSEDLYDIFLTNSAPSEDLSPLIHSFLLKDLKSLTDQIAQVRGQDSILFLRSLARSFLNLYDLMPYQKSSHAIPWDTLPSPIFFKDQPLFKSATSLWTTRELKNFLEAIVRLECHIKFSKIPSSEVQNQLLSIIRK